MESNLKPCPLCHSKAKVLELILHEHTFVKCERCGCMVDDGVYGNTEEGAIERWNTRHSDGFVKDLKEAINGYKVTVYGDKHDNIMWFKRELKEVIRKYT
jgi:hypothetical protein